MAVVGQMPLSAKASLPAKLKAAFLYKHYFSSHFKSCDGGINSNGSILNSCMILEANDYVPTNYRLCMAWCQSTRFRHSLTYIYPIRFHVVNVFSISQFLGVLSCSCWLDCIPDCPCSGYGCRSPCSRNCHCLPDHTTKETRYNNIHSITFTPAVVCVLLTLYQPSFKKQKPCSY